MSDRKKAIALSYEQSMDSPQVVAKGAGLVAERILALAEENDIPIHEDPALCRFYSALDIKNRFLRTYIRSSRNFCLSLSDGTRKNQISLEVNMKKR